VTFSNDAGKKTAVAESAGLRRGHRHDPDAHRRSPFSQREIRDELYLSRSMVRPHIFTALW
jgi:hypothetical protein